MHNIKVNSIIAAAFILVSMTAVFPADPVAIRFCWWGDDLQNKSTLEAVRLFEKKNPDVAVKKEYLGWNGYSQHLVFQYMGGDEPDVMQVMWTWISTVYSKNGDGFYNLYNVKQHLKLEEFGGNIRTGIVNGKLNALPVAYSPNAYLWKKNVFDKAGIKIPETWEDLFKAGKRFESRLGKDYYPLDGRLYDVILMAHSYLMQKYNKQLIDPDVPIVAINREEAGEFIRFYKKLSESHSVVSVPERFSIASPEAATERQIEWLSGRWGGMHIWDSGFLSRDYFQYEPDRWKIGSFLAMKGAKNGGVFGRPAMMYTVSRNSKNPEAAARLIGFLLTDPDAVKIQGYSKGIPFSKSANEILQKDESQNLFIRKTAEKMRSVKVDLLSPYFEHAKIQRHLRDLFELVSFGKISDEKAVDGLIDGTNRILKSL